MELLFSESGFEMEYGDYFDFWSKNQTTTDKSFFFNFDNPGLGYIDFDKAHVNYF
jgi:hypothetical protein